MNETTGVSAEKLADFAISEATQFGLPDEVIVRGWAADPRAVASVRVRIDSHPVGTTPLNAERPDVAAKLGHPRLPMHGFILQGRCAAPLLARRSVEVTFVGRGGQPLATLSRAIVQSHRLDKLEAVYDSDSRQFRIRGCVFPAEQLRRIAVVLGNGSAHTIRNIFQYRPDGVASDPRRRTLYSGFHDRVPFAGEGDVRNAQLKLEFLDGTSKFWPLPPGLVRMNAPDAEIEEIRLDWLRDHAEVRGWFRSYTPVTGITLHANGQRLHGIPAVGPSERIQTELGYRGQMAQEFRLSGPLDVVAGNAAALFAGEVEMSMQLTSRDEVLLSLTAQHPRLNRSWGRIGLMMFDRRNDVFHCSGTIAGPILPVTAQLSVNGRALDKPLPVEARLTVGRGFFSWTHTINGAIPPTGQIKLEFFGAAGESVGALIQSSATCLRVSRHGAVDGLNEGGLADRLLGIYAEPPQLPGASVCFVFQGTASGAGAGGGLRRMTDLMESFHDAGYATVLIDRSEPWSALKWPEQYRRLRRICDHHIMVPQAAKRPLFDKLGALVKAGKFPTPADFKVGGQTMADLMAKPPQRASTEGMNARIDPLFNLIAACLVNALAPRVAVTSFVWSGGFHRFLHPSVHGMIDTNDVQALRAQVFADAQEAFGPEAVPDLAKYDVKLDEEIALLSAAGSVIAISRDEHAFLCEHIAPQKVVYAGMSARIAMALPPSAPDSRRILFVGNSYEPNSDGISVFLREVWPAVRARVPGVRLAVCGRVAADIADAATEGVELLGPVEDLAAEYHKAALALNPVRFGTGTSAKLVETLAMGRCMVSTPTGARGFEAAAEAGALAVAGLEAFAERICALLLDPAARAAMETAALRFAARELAPEVVHADLFNLLESRLYY